MMARRSGRKGRLALAAALVVSPAAAAPDFALVWEAPKPCPSAEQVRKKIRRRLGAERSHGSLTARATVTREAPAFRVRLETYGSGRRGVRELQAPTCDALVDAVAVIVAMAADSEPLPMDTEDTAGPDTAPALDETAAAPDGSPASMTEGSDRSATARSTGAAPGSLPVRADVPAPGEARQGPSASEPARLDDETDPDGSARPFRDLGLQGVASLAGAVESGVLPGLGFGLTARGGIRLRRLRAEAAISRWFAREASSVEPGSGADIHGMSLAVWGCFRAVPAHTAPVPTLRAALPPDDSPAIEAGPCLGAELGQLNARSFGVSTPADGNGAYFAAGGGLRVGATAADWMSLDVRFEAFRILQAPEFRVRNLGVVHQPADWSLRAALGAEAYFP